MMNPVELKKLLINEVSGVDDPANEIPGWMVQKAAEPGETAAAAAPVEDATSFVTRLKDALGVGTGKEHDDMTPEELKAELDTRDTALVDSIGKAVAEAVTKAVTPAEAAPAPAAPAPAATETAPAVGLQIEDVETALIAGIEKALEPYNTALEAVLNRLENTEKAFGIAARTSLDGQESADGAKPATKSKESGAPAATGALGAIRKALQNPGKPVYLAGDSGDGSLGR